MSEYCPQCGAARTGAFRFCRSCRFDFEASPIASATSIDGASGPLDAAAVSGAVRPARTYRRLTGRQWIGAVVAVFVGLSVLGSITNPTPSPAAAQSDAAARARTTSPPSYWATIRPQPAALAPTGPTETATVVRIVDGDTIVIALGGTNVKLRYIGIDTPETVDPDGPVEPGGAQATSANTALVAGKTVVLEKDVSETDPYGRLLRYVWLQDADGWTLVNLELVRLGVASAISYPPDTKYDNIFGSAQTGAQSQFLGLWGIAATAAPTVAPTPRATPRATPRPTPKPTKKPSSCHPSYLPCLPIVGDLDCPDVRAMGKAPVSVIGPDDYRLDGDRDGIGCE